MEAYVVFIAFEKLGVLGQLATDLVAIPTRKTRSSQVRVIHRALRMAALTPTELPESAIFSLAIGCNLKGDLGLFVTYNIPQGTP